MRLRIAIALLLLVPLGAMSGSALHQAPQPDTLYLRPDPDGGRAHNFSTHPPDAGAQAKTLAMRTQLNLSTIDWSTPYLPVPWTIGPGADATVELWIQGLDRVVALADPLSASRRPGEVVIRADLFHGGSIQPFATGETGVATDLTASGDAPQGSMIDLEVAREVTFSNDSASGETLRLVVTVFGHNRPETPLLVHVLSPETPSRLIAAGFPVDAFRAWEDIERAEAECNERVLQDLPCETTTPGPDPDEEEGRSGTASFPWVLGLAAVAVALLVVLVTTRRR